VSLANQPAIAPLMAARLASSASGHVMFLKNQVPLCLPVSQSFSHTTDVNNGLLAFFFKKLFPLLYKSLVAQLARIPGGKVRLLGVSALM
jgi:hypothetical protein